MTFGEKLQKLRTRAGLSQDQLAKLLDVSRQADEQVGAERGYAGGGEARPASAASSACPRITYCWKN